MPATVLASDALLVQLAAARRTLIEPLARAAALVVAHRAWVYCGYQQQGDYTRERLHREPRWLRDLANLHHVRAEGSAATARESAPHAEESENRALVTHLLPPDAKLAFETAFELHRCIAGREVGAAEFVEALVGEAVSAGCMPPDDFEPRLRLRTGSSRSRVARTPPKTETSSDRNILSAARVPPALQTPALRQALRRLAEFESLQARLRRLELKLEVLETRFAPEAQHQTQDRAGGDLPRARKRDLRLGGILSQLLQLENGFDIALGDLLLELHEHRAWRTLRVASLETYAEDRLGLGRSTARRRVALARALRRLPVVRSAYETGQIGFMAAVWVARSLQRIHADATTQELWIEHAKQTTYKRQRDEERRREHERLRAMIDIAHAAIPEVRSGSGGTHRALESANVVALNGTTVASTDGTAHFSPPADPKHPTPMTDAAWHAALRRVPGAALDQVLGLGYGLLDRILRRGPLLQVPLVLDLPELDATNLLGCIEGARRQLTTLAARELAPDDECRLGPAARVARTFVVRLQRVPDWVGLLALLEEYVLAHDRPEKRARRSPIAERDGYRCMAPGCTSRTNLQVHHVRYRSQQGGDEPANLVLLCAFHHLQGEHGGLARCRGRAPLDMLWRLGCDDFATWFRNERRVALRKVDPPEWDEVRSCSTRAGSHLG